MQKSWGLNCGNLLNQWMRKAQESFAIHEVKNNSNKQNENLFNIELRMVIRD